MVELQNGRIVDELLQKFLSWAQGQADIVAVLNQGSRARSDHPADRWSDLDLIVFTTNKSRYLNDSSWLQNLGRPMITHLEKTAVGDEVERRAIFEGGVDVDFSIISTEELASNVQTPNEQDLDMIRRGVRVLLDKTGTIETKLSQLSSQPAPRREPPSKEEFEMLVNDFVYHVYWTAKKLRRKELWTAHGCCDGYMKRRLLTMIEWNTMATRGWDTDIWFNGRFMEEWASPETLKALKGTFAHYDLDDTERALFATTDLFMKLAKDTEDRLGYDELTSHTRPVLRLARECLG